MKDDAQFYIGQKALILKDDKILILKNEGFFDVDFPGGKIQEGEMDLTEALKREVREETGLEIQVGPAFATGHRVFPSNHRFAGKRLFLVGYIYANTYQEM